MMNLTVENRVGSKPPHAGRRERTATVLAATLWLAVASCGGSAHNRRDAYRVALSKQEACCDALAEPAARDACRARLVRVGDKEVEKTSINQATFGCVERHFVCDGSTGEATMASKQSQLECLIDLGG